MMLFYSKNIIYSFYCLATLFFCFVWLIGCQESDQSAINGKKVTKLQIGIKKRVDDCQRRSSKGDLLHIHYRVFIIIIIIYLYLDHL